MSDLDQATAWSLGLSSDLPEGFLASDDYADADEGLVIDDGRAAGLVGIRYIGAALRRRWRLWCTLTVVGLVIGAGLYVKIPPADQASTTVLLADSPTQDPIQQNQVDLSLAQSTAVAQGIISQLGLQMTPNDVLKKYTVIAVNYHALTITASAPTSQAALQLASAAATQLLKFRAGYVEAQQRQSENVLNQQVSQARQHLDSISSQITHVSSQPATPAQQSELKNLQAQQAAASSALAQVQQYVLQELASTRADSQAMVQGSQVLDAAVPVKHSFLKSGAFYIFAGVVGGLALGLAIVVISAITSDRLRRRDDIARAFGAPVRLSVGPLRKGRLPELGRRRAAIRRRDGDRVVEYLRHEVSASPSRPASLAVVAVDDVAVAARMVVALAVSSATRGEQVTVADLSAGARAAHLLGTGGTGGSQVTRNGVSLRVIVPGADDVAPVGPLGGPAAPERGALDEGALAGASARADLLLTLVTLDPAFGADHLPTWATDAVAVVTAGQSTGVRINAVGEMLRLAGMRRSSVIVAGTDKGDESLGAMSAVSSSVSL